MTDTRLIASALKSNFNNNYYTTIINDNLIKFSQVELFHTNYTLACISSL